MSWKRDRPRVFEKVWLTRSSPYLRVQVAIFYQPRCYKHKEEFFYAELDGKRVEGRTPDAVRQKLPELIKIAHTYSAWGFYLRLDQDGSERPSYRDEDGTYSKKQDIGVEHQLLLLGRRSDGRRVSARCHLSPDGIPHVGPAIKHPEGKSGPCCKGPGTDFSLIDTAKITEWTHVDVERTFFGKKKVPKGHMGEGVVPFTPERLRWLLRLEAAIGELRGKIGKIMDGSGHPLEHRLDAAITAQRLPLELPLAAKDGVKT